MEIQLFGNVIEEEIERPILGLVITIEEEEEGLEEEVDPVGTTNQEDTGIVMTTTKTRGLVIILNT